MIGLTRRIKSKCKLELDKGKYIECGILESLGQAENDAYKRFALQHGSHNPLKLLINIEDDTYVCALYENSPRGNKRKDCKTCVLYSENTNGKKLGNGYHPHVLTMSNPPE